MSALLNALVTTEHRLRKAIWMVRGYLLRCYLRLHGCSVGPRLKCKQWPTFRQVPHGNIRLGPAVTIGYRVTIDVGAGAILDIGAHVNLTQDILISCGRRVRIGDYSGLGEFSSVRDGDHGYAADNKIHEQPATYSEIVIGSDVQISRGCLVTGGSHIEHGVIIGANSAISGSIKTVEYCMYIGQPVKFIGKRM